MTDDEIKHLITKAALTYGIDPAIALAQAKKESGFNPKATSHAGARGIFQIMPATGKALGLNSEEDFTDPVKNINAGMKYMATLLHQFNGDYSDALASFNSGPTKVAELKKVYGDKYTAHLPEETRNYTKSILKDQQGFKKLEEHTNANWSNRLKPEHVRPQVLDQYKVTSPYGYRTAVTGEKKGSQEFNNGIDFVTPDMNLYSHVPGTIVAARGDRPAGFQTQTKDLGNYILVKAPDGSLIKYGHLDPFDSKSLIGKEVKPGDLLASAKTGSGSGTGPHVKMYAYQDPGMTKSLDPTEIYKGKKQFTAPQQDTQIASATEPSTTGQFFTPDFNKQPEAQPKEENPSLPQFDMNVYKQVKELLAQQQGSMQTANAESKNKDEQVLAMKKQATEKEIADRNTKLAEQQKIAEANKAADAQRIAQTFQAFKNPQIKLNPQATPYYDEGQMNLGDMQGPFTQA